MLQAAVPILASINAEETINFYTQKLGFIFHSNWDGYLIFSKDGVQLHLWPTTDQNIPKNTGCYINVDNVNELYQQYGKHNIIHPNGHIKDMDWEMRQFSVLDNNGNIIHFGQDISEQNK